MQGESFSAENLNKNHAFTKERFVIEEKHGFFACGKIRVLLYFEI